MHDLYKLKENLMKELEDYGKEGGVSRANLDVIDKLAHATKNVSKVIECCENDGGYSKGMSHDSNSYADGYYVRPDGSYARGRGAGAKRDSMGRYSRDGEGLDEHTKAKLREMIEKL